MRNFLASLLFIVGIASFVLADNSVPVYNPGRGGLILQGIAVADTATIDPVTSVVDCGYNQVVRVDAKFTAASATCKIHFIRLDSGRCSMTTATASADAIIKWGAKYVADSIAFDTGTFKSFKIQAEAPSSGSVDVEYTVCGK